MDFVPKTDFLFIRLSVDYRPNGLTERFTIFTECVPIVIRSDRTKGESAPEHLIEKNDC